MHFYKYVDKKSADPRCKNYYEYHCNSCGHIHCFESQNNFDTDRFRKCPKCNIINDLNDFENLSNKKKELEDKIKYLQNDLQSVEAKLEILTMTGEGNASEIPRVSNNSKL